MQVKITLTLDVGDDPTADGITYMIGQYGIAEGDGAHSPEEWAESVVDDVVMDLIDDTLARQGTTWGLLSSFVEVV